MSATFDELIAQLSDYPHVQKYLKVFWGEVECRKYLTNLSVSDRDGRQGFPMQVLIIIDKLITLHDSTYPQHKPKFDTWDVI